MGVLLDVSQPHHLWGLGCHCSFLEVSGQENGLAEAVGWLGPYSVAVLGAALSAHLKGLWDYLPPVGAGGCGELGWLQKWEKGLGQPAPRKEVLGSPQ